MALALVVTNDFGEYRRGQHITEAAEMEAVQASEDARHTVRVNLPDEPDAPASKGKAAAKNAA